MVAKNKNSINSPYHREDMRLIANASSDCLRPENVIPAYGLNYLAINKNSLKDKYHLENMKILLNNKNVDSPYHLENLKHIINGEEIIRVNTIDTYLDELESNIENTKREKVLSKIKKILKK